MNIRKALQEAGKLAKEIAQHELRKAKRKAKAEAKKQLKRQIQSTKKQALAFVGWPKAKTKKGKV